MSNQRINQARPLFELGRTLATPGAVSALATLNASPLHLLGRHHRGDWGDLDAVDQQINNDALNQGGRIFSAYQLETVRF